MAPCSHVHARAQSRWITAACILLAIPLAQCGKAPNADMLAANTQPAGDTFEDRFPAPQFKDRFPTEKESLVPYQRTAAAAPAPQKPAPSPVRVASISPTLTLPQPTEREELTTLVSLKSSAFPYFGNNPRTDAPFLNVGSGDHRGHRSYGGRVYWQNETYNDSRVLMHVPESFDINKPGVIVVFFHGNGATLERDVRDRQLVPQQITDSGVNAVLLAPQMAVDAADSSAGKFWQPGGLKRFLDESAGHLARLYGDPKSAQAFASMPVVLVGYSGGFLPTAWSLDVGGATSRVRGVLLLDAVYGELDKFASWIENNRSGFFVSSYTHYTRPHDRELMSMLRNKGIAVSESMDGPLRPGSVVFVQTRDGITHRSYVTQAWTEFPIKEVLTKMAATPALRLASVPAQASR
ncbi:alpha/beta hydrolase [Bradyrhizobium jicamae]|uniref:Alpha/beta hydrolase n=1 Tax=Bradyrhizobium jicamae TaxID=280332 RepID=A0ABS5FVJ7_9BRAD|nr:alpha/beta hydrolase [Bradyrhizobium jicamae]MBR0800868.1 alpha/beta hydrolase [Bradyrhizobium jicamae]MBR0934780.1 alpha/beta hydrolase [Bradyrhizobium jicamae]